MDEIKLFEILKCIMYGGYINEDGVIYYPYAIYTDFFLARKEDAIDGDEYELSFDEDFEIFYDSNNYDLSNHIN